MEDSSLQRLEELGVFGFSASGASVTGVNKGTSSAAATSAAAGSDGAAKKDSGNKKPKKYKSKT